ncbi:MAG: hypothetical protein JSV39_04745 [Candidatus Aenigmatarchaeota archaeon]|nr:MAG: hypothetical protein JSV39_04745 [Candidatus Aenigmarchaeota archaeon]
MDNDNSLVVEEDDVIIYYVSGNESGQNATPTNPEEFILRVFDADRNAYNITENLYMSFNVTPSGFGSQYITLDPPNTTNESGYVYYYFYPDTSFSSGKQNWIGFVNTTAGYTSCYEYNYSGTYNVTVEVNWAPKYRNLTVNGKTTDSKGWGGGWNFSVEVNDTENDDLNITLQIDTGSGWQDIKKENCSSCPEWTKINFTNIQLNCSDINSSARFRFNITDEAGNLNGTDTYSTFSVRPDEVIFEHVSGNDTTANRSGVQIDTLKLRLDDVDNSTYLPAGVNVTLWVSYTGPPGYVYDDGHNLVTDSDGNITYNFDPNCSADPGPEYSVGEQKWYAKVNSSEQCYYANESSVFNLSVMGDFNLSVLQPDGDTNYTWGDLVYHLAKVLDDCGNNVDYVTPLFNASTPGYSDNFTATGIGGGVYQANWDSTGAKEGWYNVTFIVNKTNYYDNQTTIEPPNTFYLETIPILEFANVSYRQEGWGRKFNFTVNVTDEVGDNVTIEFYAMKSGGAWNQIGNEINCTSCSNFTAEWETNFTCGDIGTWFFRFTATDQNGNYDETRVADGEYVGDDNSFLLQKDDIQILYVSGNESNAFYNSTNVSNSTYAKFVLLVNDTDSGNFAYNPSYSSPRIKFNVTMYGLAGNYYPAGDPDYNVSNSSGHVVYNFLPNCSFQQVKQKWRGYIDPGDTCYKDPPSGEYNVTVQTEGCEPSLAVSNIDSAYEIFENKTIFVRATISAIQGAATNVNATIDVPSDWVVSPSIIRNLGTIGADSSKTTNWTIDITSYNSTTSFSVFANSSEGLNDTADKNITVYKLLEKDDYQGQQKNLTQDGEMVFGFPCPAGEYRTGNLTINWTGSETFARVYVYNSTGWIDVLHSHYVNSPGEIFVPILNQQTRANETGYCSLKVKNVGTNNLTFVNASFEGYFKPGIQITDIIKRVNGTETNGMEPGDGFFNVTLNVTNSEGEAYTANITLNITNSSGYVVNSSTHYDVNIPASSSVLENFTDVNTTGWIEDIYSITANVVYSIGEEERVENLVFRNVSVYSETSDYFCNSTTEELNVTIYHPFTDEIEYNITFEKPSGWTVSPAYMLVNISSAGNQTLNFNVTTDNTDGNFTVNVTLNYTYPSNIEKSKTSNFSIENDDDIAIFEVIRETPRWVDKNRVFESSLVIHNKGCGKPMDDVVLKEIVPTGWFPANPSLSGVQSAPPSIDLDTNVISWYMEKDAFGVNNYSVASYQAISPNTYSTTGDFRYNVSWGYKGLWEKEYFEITTMNYSSESHLEFELIVYQRPENPWPEVRSIQPNVTYNYSLKVRNIGDVNTSNEWNASLFISPDCNATDVYNGGSYNASNNEIVWSVPDIGVRKVAYLNFTLNCSETGRKVFRARGVRDTRGMISYVNDTYIDSTGSSNTTTNSFGFSHPAEPYEKISEIRMLVNYNFTGTNLTIGEANVSVEDDSNLYRLAWQNYSFENVQGQVWSNYTMDSDEKEEFAGSLSADPVYHNVRVYSHSDATLDPDTNITVTKLNYTWEYGKLFEEGQELFTKVKVYYYTPLLENESVIRDSGGWGEEWNFTVKVRDRFSRNVTVRLWHQYLKSGPWENYTLLGEYNCTNCIDWTQVNFTYDYNCSHIASWEYFFNATNPDGESNTSVHGYEIEQDDVSVYNVTPPQNEHINRSQTTQFIVQMNDTDNKTYPNNTDGKIKMTTVNLGTWGTYTTPTNGTGHIILTMATTDWCDGTSWSNDQRFNLGEHKWRGGFESSTCYKDNLTSELTFDLYGDLVNDILYPDSSKNYTRGSQITINGSLVNYCGDNITVGTVRFNLTNGGFTDSCSASHQGGGIWECPITMDSGFPFGWYNVTMNSSKSDYNTNVTIEENVFVLGSVPRLDDINLENGVYGCWGESPFNFTVNVSDQDSNNVTVKFYLNSSQTGWTWVEYGEQTVNSSQYGVLTFNYTFVCNETYSDVGTWYYRFTANDSWNFQNDTLDFLSLGSVEFGVIKDYIQVNVTSGNNSAINRSDSQPDNEVNLSYQLWDTIVDNYTTFPDNNTEVRTWFLNKTSWVELQELVNSTHYYYNFNPTCSLEAGKTYWKVNVSGDECYNDTESELFPIEVIGDLNNTVLYPLGFTQYDQGDPVPLNGTVVDDCGRDVSNVKVRFRMNATPATFYYCPDPGYVTNTTGNYYNCTWDTSSIPAGHYNVTMISWNDSYNNDTEMAIADLFLTAPVTLENASVSPDPGGWGDTFNFTINVTHYTNVTVCLVEKVSGDYIAIECRNSTGVPDHEIFEFNNTYGCGNIGSRFYRFNASETVGGFAYAEEPNGSEVYFDIIKDNLTFIDVAGNGVNVTRSGEDYASLVVYVNDTTSGQPAVWIPAFNSPNISFNITETSWSVGDYVFEGRYQPNSTGHVKHDFNATCNHKAARQYWRTFLEDGDVCYNSETSIPYNVTTIGTLYPNVTWPNGSEYEESVIPAENIVPIYGDVMDECNYSLYINTSTVNFTVNHTAGGGSFNCSTITNQGNGTYNCTWDFNGKPYGWYDVIMNASDVPYYNNNSRTKSNTFRINPHTFSPPDLNNETYIYEQDGGWGENFTFRVNASDIDAETVNITFYLSDDNSTWTDIENKTCDNCLVPRWVNFYYAGFGPDNITGPGDYVYFKFNATDPHNITSRPGFNFTIDKDDVSIL